MAFFSYRQLLKNFLFSAVSMGFDIIPLVQTFGHMEFALKLETYKRLRENSMYPNAICPSQEKTLDLIKEVIDQIVTFHKEFGIRRLHIGNDEVYHVAECSLCSKKAASDPLGNASLILEHMKYVAEHVVSKGLVPMVWHDMLIKMPDKAIQKYDLPSLVEVVVWDYTPDLRYFPSQENWLKFQRLFKGKLWLASAFKGATGVSQQLTNPQYHLKNHENWVRTAAKYGSDIPFLGIILTGWQRYDHFAVLCELLPVGIPSLIYNLNYLADPLQPKRNLVEKVSKVLKCSSSHPLDVMNMTSVISCDFPGAKIYEIVQEIHQLERDYYKIKTGSHMIGWVTSFHIENSYTNPDHVRLAMRGVRQIVQRYFSLLPVVNVELLNVYEHETAAEWLDLNFFIVNDEIKKLESRAEKLMATMTWPRRFFDLNKSWYELRARTPLIITH